MKYDTEKLLKLIEDTFDEYKEKYKYKLDKLYSDPVIKALTKFKKYIINNKDTKTINGRTLNEYNPKIKEEYNIIHNIIQKRTLTNDITNRNIKKLKKGNTYSKINKIPKLNIELLNNDNNIDNSNKLNTICSSRDLTIGKKIKMNFGFFSYEEEAKKKKENIKKIEEYLNTKDTDINNSKEIDNNEINELIDKDKKLNEKKENDISFLSLADEKEKKYKYNICKIKNMDKLKIMNENEKNLLKGYIREEPKQEKYMMKLLKPKLKTSGQHYLENLELLKKTNSLAFKMDSKKEERNLKYLEKKLMALRINDTNSLKKIKCISKYN